MFKQGTINETKPFVENHFENYLLQYNPAPTIANPAHTYTIEIHHAMYTEELFELYKKYEKAIHKRDRDSDNLKR